MNIEVGKYYKTAAGQRVYVCSITKPGECPIVAWSDYGVLYNYDTTGMQSLMGGGGAGLLAEWVDKPTMDRSVLPAWANKAVVMETSGSWYACSKVPSICSDGFGWNRSVNSVYVPREYFPKWNGDWKDSLITWEGEE